MSALVLQRVLQGDDRPEWDRWARFDVVDDVGHHVGIVTEEHEDEHGPATYTAVHNPTGEAWGALWRSEGHGSPADALGALADHLARQAHE